MSLLQTIRLRRRRRPRERSAIPAHCRAGARCCFSRLADPAKGSGAPQSLAHACAPPRVPPPPPRCRLWPWLAPGAAPSSNYARLVGAMCTRLHPRSGPLQPSPSHLRRANPCLRPTRRPAWPTSLGPPAAPHTARSGSIPSDRRRGMKILIKNLSPSRTHCQQEGKHLCSTRSVAWYWPSPHGHHPHPQKETSKMYA